MWVLDFNIILIILFFITLVFLWIKWVYEIGILKSTLAIICRALWLSPILLSLYPQVITRTEVESVSFDKIHVFVDDSWSMNLPPSKTQNQIQFSSRIKEGLKIVDFIKSKCFELGCTLSITYLSDLSPMTKKGYTELHESLKYWFNSISAKDSWIVISDGGDTSPYKSFLSDIEDTHNANQGLVIGFESFSNSNKWIQYIKMPPLAFEQKPFFVDVTIGREGSIDKDELLQLQVFVNERHINTTEINFYKDEEMKTISVAIPGLTKGSHLVKFKLLPTADEKDLWDNEFEGSLEVLPDTVGVLHLLGSPSWDGRFLRRFLKLEPKYALISFFILRDPWDMPYSSERELSLIPFPVDRLFKEELSNFKLIIMQNFSLFEFLEPQYQTNLVNFIKNGGSLLFIGGPRSFNFYDLQNSDLSQILPFKINQKKLTNQQFSNFNNNFFGVFRSQETSYIPYDKDQTFKLKFADISYEKRQMSSVYEDLLQLKSQLMAINEVRGLHRSDNVEFKQEEHTPLINALLPSGKEIPLVVSSYPQKGRAIWILTDSLWKVAVSQNSAVPQDTYNKFLYKIINWLLKEEIQKPLVLKNFKIQKDFENKFYWQVELYGPSLKYFDVSTWEFKICNIILDSKNLVINRISNEFIVVEGSIEFFKKINTNMCALEVQTQHPSFGFIKASMLGSIKQPYSDKEITESLLTLNTISKLKNVPLIIFKDNIYTLVNDWLTNLFHMDTYKNTKVFLENKFYWIFEKWWFYLLILFLPLEVLVRRWTKIFLT